MRLAKINLLWVLIAVIFLSGCASMQFAEGPDVTLLQHYVDTPTWVVQDVADSRGNEKAGHIGLMMKTIVKSADLTKNVTDHLVYMLNSQERINVLRAPVIDPAVIAGQYSSENIRGILSAKIKSVNVSSLDILIPIKSEMTMELVLYDASGKELLAKVIFAKSPEGVLPMTPTQEKKIIGSVITEMMRMIAEDQEIHQILFR